MGKKALQSEKKRPSVKNAKVVGVTRPKRKVSGADATAPVSGVPAAGETTPKPVVSASAAGEAVAGVERKPAATTKQKTQTKSTKKPTNDTKSKRAKSRAKMVVGVLFVVLLVATALLSWNHWLRFDDNADIQGRWIVEGTASAVTVDAENIVLTDSVAYTYDLDTFNKTITFHYDSLSGSASYAFSPERDVLVITEHDASAEGGTAAVRLIKEGSAAQARAAEEAAAQASAAAEAAAQASTTEDAAAQAAAEGGVVPAEEQAG